MKAACVKFSKEGQVPDSLLHNFGPEETNVRYDRRLKLFGKLAGFGMRIGLHVAAETDLVLDMLQRLYPDSVKSIADKLESEHPLCPLSQVENEVPRCLAKFGLLGAPTQAALAAKIQGLEADVARCNDEGFDGNVDALHEEIAVAVAEMATLQQKLARDTAMLEKCLSSIRRNAVPAASSPLPASLRSGGMWGATSALTLATCTGSVETDVVLEAVYAVCEARQAERRSGRFRPKRARRRFGR